MHIRVGNALVAIATLALLPFAAATGAQADPNPPGGGIQYWCDTPRMNLYELKGTRNRFRGCPHGAILLRRAQTGEYLWMYGGSCSFFYYENGGRSFAGVRDHCKAKRL